MSSEASSSATLPVERSLNRQQILDEDEYTAALSHIIARDFFPSLVHLDASHRYLDALDTRDPHLINASIRRIEQINATPIRGNRSHIPPMDTPMATPYVSGGRPFDTPMPLQEPQRPRYDESLRLDTFQARYTSEDNSSFTQILDSENQARKDKWGWAWEAQRKAENSNLLIAASRDLFMLEAPSTSVRPGVREKIMIEAPNQPSVAGLLEAGKPVEETPGEERTEEPNDRKGKGKQVTVVRKREHDADEERDVMAPPKAPRHAGMDGWKFKARNSLMFPPDADESPYTKGVNSAKITKPEDTKTIAYSSTRLPEQDDDTSTKRQLSAPPSPSPSRINAAIQGAPYRHLSPGGGNNFKLVPNLPSPTASELGPTAVKQLMTWGTLNATPRVISHNDVDLPSPSTPFHLPNPSKREQISQKLSNNASKSLRAKAGLLRIHTPGARGSTSTPVGRRSSMAPPSWTPRRSEADLTPAAKRLLDRTTMGALASRRAEAMERASHWTSQQTKERDLKKIRWTPTPGV